MEKIGDMALYRQVYEAALKKARNGEIPTRLFRQGDVLYRGIPRERVHLVDCMVTSSSAEEQIWVRDLHENWNRFSGVSPDPKVQVTRGGCYFFQHEAAGIAEMRHYALEKLKKPPTPEQLTLDLGSPQVSIPHLLASKCILKIKLMSAKLVADLSLFSGGQDVGSILRSLGLPPQSPRDDDYSVARALGHAMQAVPHLHGLIAQTARETERGGETGDNICLFGVNHSPVEGLSVESALFFFPPGLMPSPAQEIVEVGIRHEARSSGTQLALSV